MTNLQNYINQLITAGAQYIIWPNLPELDQIPHTRETRDITNPFDSSLLGAVLGDTLVQGYTPATDAALEDAVQTFNLAWAAAISTYSSSTFRSSHPGVTVYGLNVHSLFEGMLNKNYPEITNTFDTTDEASQSNLVNNNADNYLFWDGMHPTEFVHILLGDAAADLINDTERQLRFGHRHHGAARPP